MLLVTNLIGDGTAVHPYRSAFPTAILIDFDEVAGEALVDVPDDDLPEGWREVLSGAKVWRDGVPESLTGEEAAAQLAEHLDARYAERAGQFRPQLGVLRGGSRK